MIRRLGRRGIVAAIFGRRRSLTVVAPINSDSEPHWLSALLNLRGLELSASVLGIVQPDVVSLQGSLQAQLARYEIPTQLLAVGTRLRPLITFRRRRTELRSTPTGGVVRVDVEEEVG